MTRVIKWLWAIFSRKQQKEPPYLARFTQAALDGAREAEKRFWKSTNRKSTKKNPVSIIRFVARDD
ncbi:hypothetical protein COU01_04015 [Candidatus Falkowbacteria bacterium CG10_big_fil_rev_8_21_14_0_10_44_15]|uniref:Uncharacterized protein n=1 Tax=Candidatus Falkowbacteria bacterium CG10_big_fil_rev_8_21_14_0_10_44_15 TaxID=1974569 RepID=A0A2H0V0Q2_9BACT|nr:MAG: hypothetical protein COU01_04015 [Candidatus Falkowbacteria bacterium CG10_big_fil_rev_8_21_14_0_10_44_15]